MFSRIHAKRLLREYELALVGSDCRRRFTALRTEQENALVATLVEHYYLAKGKVDPRSSPDLADDLDDAMYGTIWRNRSTVVPWLNSLRPLDGMRILEIGTGAGGSIVPLTEQGAYVVGTDIDRNSLAVAAERLRLHGLAQLSELHVINAVDLEHVFRGQTFDTVIFFASLEHMTIGERLRALPAAWSLVSPGGRFVVVETPNRLWWYDGHTSELPFYNWLPDCLALQYRNRSSRTELSGLAGTEGREGLVPLARLGRGVSFHEFQIALPGLDLTQVDSSMRQWLRQRSPLRWMAWRASGNAAFAKFLRRAAPALPSAFFEPYLDLAIAKK